MSTILLVSTTTLEKFRRFMAGTSQWDTEEALLAAIKGEFKGTEKTAIGQAFHRIIEKYNQPTVEKNLVDSVSGITFTKEQASVANEYRQLYPAAREVPSSKIYEARHLKFKVNCRADALEGLRIRDIKFTFKPPHYVDYFNSFQWRIYCDIYQAESFAYDIFECRGFKGLVNNRFEGSIEFHPPYEMLPYDGMQAEIDDLIRFFGDWIEVKQIQNLFKTA